MTRTLQLLTAALTFQLFSRGMDYALGNPRAGVGAFRLADASPSLVWGIACVTAALIVATGLAARRDHVVRAGAVIAAAIYTAFAIMVFGGAFAHGAIDDWRFFTAYVAAAFMWAVIAWALTIRMAVIAHREGRDGDA